MSVQADGAAWNSSRSPIPSPEPGRSRCWARKSTRRVRLRPWTSRPSRSSARAARRLGGGEPLERRRAADRHPRRLRHDASDGATATQYDSNSTATASSTRRPPPPLSPTHTRRPGPTTPLLTVTDSQGRAGLRRAPTRSTCWAPWPASRPHPSRLPAVPGGFRRLWLDDPDRWVRQLHLGLWRRQSAAGHDSSTVSHTYAERGVFTPTLTVTDDLGTAATASGGPDHQLPEPDGHRRQLRGDRGPDLDHCGAWCVRQRRASGVG